MPPSLTVPVVDGRLALGTWQSICLLDPNADNAVRTVRLVSSPAEASASSTPGYAHGRCTGGTTSRATSAGLEPGRPLAGAVGRYTPANPTDPLGTGTPTRVRPSHVTPRPSLRVAEESPMPLRSDSENFALIRVIGVGGGGSNAVNRMIRAEMMGVEFIACNTDAQALLQSDAPHKIRIGDKITRGLGAGGDATIGQRAAEEDSEKIARRSSTRTWSSSPPGSVAGPARARRRSSPRSPRRAGALTIGVVTKPFTFEGAKRKLVAEKAAEELKAQVDTLITIPNDRLKDVVQKNTSILDAFRVVDDVLRQGVQGISDIITMPGLINLDFADVRAIMKDAGSALMGIGRAIGREPRRRGGPPGDRQPAPRGRHRGRPGHPVQHHRLVEPEPVRGHRGGRGDPRRGRPRGQHHLRHELQRAARRRGHDHRHRHRLRRRQEAPSRAPREATGVMDSSVDRPPVARARLPRGAPAPARRGRRRRVTPSTAGRNDDEAPRPSPCPRVERSVGEPPAAKRPVTTYDADDLEIPSFLRRK